MQHFTDFLLILHVQLEIVGVNAEAEKIARAAQKVFIGVYRIPVGRGAPRKKRREMQEVRGAREKRGGREAGDKQTAQRESLCAVPFSDICPACPVAVGQEPPCPQAVGCARPRGCPPPGVGDGISCCRPGGKRGKREEDTGRLRRYRRAAPRRLPKVSAPSPQRLSSASVSHSAGSLPSPVSGTGSGSAVTRSVNTGLLVVPNVFVASQ